MKISVFTPVHKTTRFFDICIESIVKQTYQDWEWVILDNSEDRNIEAYIYNKVGEILPNPDEWKTVIEKIKVFSLIIENRKIGYLKSIASRLCTGEILCEHDYDDFMMPKGLEILAQAAEKNPDYDFFYSDYINIQHREDGKFVSRTGTCTIDSCEIEYLGETIQVNVFGIVPSKLKFDRFFSSAMALPIPIHLRAWRKEFFNLIDGYDSSLPVCDDTDLVVRSFIYGKTCRISYPCVVINYYGANSTQTFEMEELDKLVLEIMEKHKLGLLNLFKTNPDFVKRFIPEV